MLTNQHNLFFQNEFCVTGNHTSIIIIPSFIQFIGNKLFLYFLTSIRILVGKGNGTPLQYSCLENPMDGGAWWAAVYGVTQSRT